MEMRQLRLILLVSAVAVCVAGLLAVPRLLDRQEELILRYKIARHTTATVAKKEHRVNAPPGHQWVVFYRVKAFPIYNFRKSTSGDPEQGSIDSNATRRLAIAEQGRNLPSGEREESLSEEQYDALSVGDELDVAYRLRADDESVEVFYVERASP